MKISLPSDRPYSVVYNTLEYGRKMSIVIAPITKEQEDCLDTGKGTYIGNLPVSNKLTYGFGEINFEDKNDLEFIQEFDWINDVKGAIIPANYDYETHTCETMSLGIGHEETHDNIKLIKYHYARINKPKRCIIFKVNSEYLSELANDKS